VRAFVCVRLCVCVVVPVLVVVVVVGVCVVALVSVDIYEVELTYRSRKLNCHSSLHIDRAFSTDIRDQSPAII